MKNIIMTMALSALSIGAFADAPRPSEAQMKYFEADVIGIVHYGLNTYVDKEWGYGDTPTSVFQPTNLDPEQWVVAAKAGGLKRLRSAFRPDGATRCSAALRTALRR